LQKISPLFFSPFRHFKLIAAWVLV
jgi:hypothetical protein